MNAIKPKSADTFPSATAWIKDHGQARARARIKAISAVAMALIRQHGDRGNVDLAAGRARCSEWRYDGFRIWRLRYLDGAAPSLLEVFHDGAKVLIVERTADKVVRTSFKPGEWENKLQFIMRRLTTLL